MHSHENEPAVTSTVVGSRYELWRVKVSSLVTVANPLLSDVWGCGIITEKEIRACKEAGLGRKPSGMMPSKSLTREYHIARVAYLMGATWPAVEYHEMMVYSPADYYAVLGTLADDDYSPRAVRMRQQVRITDGNHRFCAAVLSGRETVNIEPMGDVAFLRSILSPVELI